MSGFLVQDKTINRVIGWLNRSDSRHDRDAILAVAGISEDDEDWTTKLGISMFQLNCDALTARYGDGDPLSVYRSTGRTSAGCRSTNHYGAGFFSVSRAKSLNDLFIRCLTNSRRKWRTDY